MSDETLRALPRARLSHPLCGASPATLFDVLRNSGGIARERWPQVAVAALASIGRLPASAIESLHVSGARLRAPLTQPPVFILGHWRSGTTHLYNVLSKSDAFAWVSPFATALPWDFLLLGRLLEPLLARALPEHRYIDRVAVERDSPQEDEIALANMTSLSFYHGLYFPERFQDYFDAGVFLDGCDRRRIESWKSTLRLLYDKLALRQPGRRLLIKNPVYTARVGLLRDMWPAARFIHIHRHPLEVFVSMRNFYRALFREFALQPWHHLDIDEIVFSGYERMMDTYLAQRDGLPEGALIEMRYEALQAEPMAELERLHRELDLPGFAAARPVFAGYLDSVRGYEKNRFEQPRDLAEAVAQRWARFYDRFGYATLP